MDLTIVVVSYNTKDLLRSCLKSILLGVNGSGEESHFTFEVWVVDNASPDGSAAMVAEEYPEVRLVTSTENLGFARANNLALEQALGRYLLLLNPDTEAKPGSLGTLIRFMEDHQGAGACGPKLLNTDGSLQRNGARFPSVLREFVCVTGLRRLAMRRYELAMGYGREDFSRTCEVDQVSGACLMVRREAYEKVGALDDRFFMFYEEVEWCHRIKSAGWQVWYVAESEVTHHWMGSVKQASKRMTDELFRSQLLYYRKTAGPCARTAIRGVMLLGIAKNTVLHAGVRAKALLRRAGLVR